MSYGKNVFINEDLYVICFCQIFNNSKTPTSEGIWRLKIFEIREIKQSICYSSKINICEVAAAGPVFTLLVSNDRKKREITITTNN